ncbi:CotH kinase family protein [Empedobacter stercoris]|uniref:CotH kinase family protein n=1 Tax=Empedobacter stercoris TaxID=1628248 RepID=UPI0021AF9BCB|nr:CotH kinase family protein [Empedobacter stercoris]UWX67968.1 CotH kinase family protein [Empedobacter stercoris]
MEINYPVWLPKTFGSQQSAEEMNGLVEVLQNHAENLSLQQKQILTSSGGIYPEKVIPSSTFPEGISQAVFLVGPGKYPNFGNKTIPANNLGLIFFYNSTFDLVTIEIPVYDDTSIQNKVTNIENRTTSLEGRIEPNGNVTAGQTTRAVNGDKVERYVQRNSFVEFKHSFADKDGYEVNSKVFVDNKFWISKVDGNKDYPSKSSTKWEEFKMSPDVDQEFDENSENAISNKKVSKFVNNIKTEDGEEQFILLSHTGQTTTNGFYRQVYPLIEGRNYRLKVWQSTAQNTAVMQYTGGGELYVSPVVTTNPTDYTIINYTPIKSGNLIFFAKMDKLDCRVEEIVQSATTEKYYVEWDKGFEYLLANEEPKIDYERSERVSFEVPPTTTNGPGISKFYDVNNVPLPIGYYELQVFQSGYFTAAALKVNGATIKDIAPKASSDAERINIDSNSYSHIYFEVTEEGTTLDINIHSDYTDCQLWKVNEVFGSKKVYLTPDDLDESLNDLSVLTKSSSATIPEPRSILRIDFDTNENLPTAKGTKINGVFKYNDFQGNSFRKYAKLGVQGTSSAGYPKKNWTLSLFNDENRSDSFKLEIGNLIAHDEFVYKADYVDITHSHNIVGNELWEQIVLSRKGFPKRETDIAYNSANTAIDSSRFDSKALGHVKGFACEMYINGVYYGLGNFNIGKKRPNYNIDNTNKNHIQLGDSVGQQNLTSFVPTQWELRSPKVSGYEEGGEIPDAEIMAKINRLLTFNGSAQSNITANIDSYYMRRNIVDYYIFSQSIYNFDGVAKNYLLTSWDSNVFAFMPYDLDSIFGMQFNGTAFFSPTANVFNHQNIPSGSLQFWQKVRIALGTDLDIRYKYLRENGILTLENLYILLKNQETKYGLERIQKEVARWNARPTLNSIPRIMNYMQQRFAYLDTHFNYIP